MTNTVAGSGIAVPPPLDIFEYGTGNCLKLTKLFKLLHNYDLFNLNRNIRKVFKIILIRLISNIDA